METTGILLQGVVVILAILLGVRTGGIGPGLWVSSDSPAWSSASVFGLGLPPGDPPGTSMLIILSVITAASVAARQTLVGIVTGPAESGVAS